MDTIKNLEEKLRYKFKERKLLQGALRHSSIKRYAIPFERLEFLGDRVLGLVIAEYVYANCRGTEGAMARMQAAFVCAETCYDIAKSIAIDNAIQTAGKHLKENKTVLADAMEAVLGALFIDSNYETVKQTILRLWEGHFLEYDESLQDPKTRLQEVCQKMSGELPAYEVKNITGSDHAPVFTVSVSALGKTAEATGHSRKDAEIVAARLLIQDLVVGIADFK